MPEPRILLEVPITFDVGGDQTTHAPMVHATIHGTPTKLIVDTGSDVHILTIELAEQLGLRAKPGEAGTDSSGASVPSWSLGDLRVEIAEQGFDLHDVVAITGPGPFLEWGIGGILSPQKLHPSAWAMLDLGGDRFALLDGDEADLTPWLAARTPEMQLLRLDRVAGDDTILVRSAIDPHDEVATMLDTGGKRTSFTAVAIPGATTGPQASSGRGVGGTEHFGNEVAEETLLVGGARLPLYDVVVEAEMDGREGLVGMDVLRGTVLTVSGDPDRPVFWQVT